MSELEPKKSRGFVVRWVLFCGLGWGGGLALGLGVAVPIEAVVGMILVTPVMLAVAGSTFGAAQWLAFWRVPRIGARWIGGTALGLGLGMTVGVVLVEVLGRALTGEQVQLVTINPLGRTVGLALMGVIAGLAVGAAQGIALQADAKIRRPWILQCALGLGLGLPAGGLAADLLVGGLQSVSGFATFLGVAGLLVGVLTVRGAAKIAAALPERRLTSA